MNKILLITQDRILRQAVVQFLFPEYDVETVERPDEDRIKAHDELSLLIVDGSSGEWTGLSEQKWLIDLQKGGRPTLWLEENGVPCPINAENVSKVPKPLDRDSFQQALDRLISGMGPETGQEPLPEASTEAAAGALDNDGNQKQRIRPGEPNPIELLEVIEEAPSKSKEKPGP